MTTLSFLQKMSRLPLKTLPFAEPSAPARTTQDPVKATSLAVAKDVAPSQEHHSLSEYSEHTGLARHTVRNWLVKKGVQGRMREPVAPRWLPVMEYPLSFDELKAGMAPYIEAHEQRSDQSRMVAVTIKQLMDLTGLTRHGVRYRLDKIGGFKFVSNGGVTSKVTIHMPSEELTLLSGSSTMAIKAKIDRLREKARTATQAAATTGVADKSKATDAEEAESVVQTFLKSTEGQALAGHYEGLIQVRLQHYREFAEALKIFPREVRRDIGMDIVRKAKSLRRADGVKQKA